MAPESKLVPAMADGAFQIAIDEDLSGTEPSRGLSLSLVLFLAGVIATVLFLKAGYAFFFLPVILPFGLGGSALGRAFRRLRPRVLRVHRGTLSFMRVGPFGASRPSSMDVGNGVHVSLQSAGIWIGSREQCALRLVAANGSLSLPLSSVEHARLFRRRLLSFFDEAGVRMLEEEDELRGGITLEDTAGERAITWSTHSSPPALSVGAVFVLPLVFFGLFVAFVAFALHPVVLVGIFMAVALFFFVLYGLAPRTTQRTVLRLGRDSWALRVVAGRRVVAATGGPGRVIARIVTRTGLDPAGSGLALSGHALELQSEGETVGVVGEGLSDPELRFLLRQISGARAL